MAKVKVFKQGDVYSSLIWHEQEYPNSVSSAVETFDSKVSDPDANLFMTISYDRTHKQFWNAVMFVNTGANISSPALVPTLRNENFIIDIDSVSSLLEGDYSKLFRYVVLSIFKSRSQEAFNALKIVTTN